MSARAGVADRTRTGRAERHRQTAMMNMRGGFAVIASAAKQSRCPKVAAVVLDCFAALAMTALSAGDGFTRGIGASSNPDTMTFIFFVINTAVRCKLQRGKV
ncbi:hypothetical protein GCM10007874_05750 [Labrys miyagiensis]|uniref:Uncharacterized protein n=1 Tax=Labrys miyagiensis TaxID=346912 RepID=A0ABQ6CFD5_9HYPH|nr:hypothetical protein GCM10007874_05750 [Labrys miyagiensis]